MKWTTIPTLLATALLLFAAAIKYPNDVSVPLGVAGLILLGAWLTMEITAQVNERLGGKRHPKNLGDKGSDDNDI